MRLETREELELVQETKGRCILIVDDEAIIRDLCARALKDYRTLQAQNGQEALRLLSEQSIDLVLVDVMMPVMNGLELLQQIKEKDAEQLVIVMTGYADKDIILRALKEDADDFIQKPINLLQLKTSIAQAFEKKALRTELMQLKQLDRIKSDFLGLVSHKLRTPTTSISLFIQNLASGTITPEDPGFQDVLSSVREESEYLAYLIQDLLYYSDIILQDNAEKPTREDLKEIVMTVIASKRPVSEHKGQALITHFPAEWPMVEVNRRRIEFALTALLDNAIKFTPPGGEITVSGEIDAKKITLSFADSGPGINPSEKPKIFEKFYQVDPNNTGQIRGFGLGLFYAREFIRDHGGDIVLESAPGQGTIMTVQLPIRILVTSS